MKFVFFAKDRKIQNILIKGKGMVITMKKIFAIILMLALCVVLSAGVSTGIAAEQEITVLLNGAKVDFDVAPILENDRTLVPLRAIFEALDMTVSYDSGEIAAEKEGMAVVLTVDSDIAYINGEQSVLDVPSRIVDDRTLVPLRFIGEAMDFVVVYDDASKTVTIDDAVKTLEPKEHDLKTDWDDEAVTINLTGSSAVIGSGGADAAGGVITISAAGTYIVSGSLTDGQIIVSATNQDRVHLILSGADITNTTGAAIYAPQCDKLILTLAEGTENTITDGGANYVYTLEEDMEPNAAIFVKDDLTINGTGSLTVNAGFNNAIGSKDDLLIVDGDITVNAANHGLRGNDSVGIMGGSFSITAGNDGIRSNNNTDRDKGGVIIEGGTFDIASAFDAIQSENDLTITGGVFNITTGGGSANAVMSASRFGDPDDATGMGGGRVPFESEQETTDDDSVSTKGLKARTLITITGGDFTIDSEDDAIHCDGDIFIRGGSFSIHSGDDGFHADENLKITDGVINISLCYEGIEGQKITISGGDITIAATDDGINASDGTGSMMGGGQRPMQGDAAEGENQAPAMGGMGRQRRAEGQMPMEADAFLQGGEMPEPTAPNMGGQWPAEGQNAPDTGENRMPPIGGGMGGFRANENLFVRIMGGNIDITASGDGIDSNGHLYIEGGTLKVSGHSMVAEGTIDADGDIIVSGGEVITAGSWEEVSDNSTQPVLLVSYTEQQPSGSVIAIKDSMGNTLLEYESKNAYSMSGFTSPLFEIGKTYSLLIDGEKRTDITLSDIVSSINDDGGAYSGRGGFGMGGRGGMGGQEAEGQMFQNRQQRAMPTE